MKKGPGSAYDKWNIYVVICDTYDFNFPIVNFPFVCSNIPAAPAYGVYISHLIDIPELVAPIRISLREG
jgi:hypothetical protein